MTDSISLMTPRSPQDTRTRREREARIQQVLTIASPLALLALWEILARVGLLDTRFFSSPSRVLVTLWDLIVTGVLWHHLSISLVRIALGLLAGAIPGIAIGLTMGLFPLVRAALQPLVSAIFPIPKLALLPLILLVFGLGEASKIVIIAIGVFFPVLINTAAGVSNIPPIYLDVAKSYEASRWHFYTTVALPGALPVIFSGLEIALSVSLLLIVAAEFVGADAGIGYMVWNAWQVFSVETMFAGLIVISALGFASSMALHSLKRKLVPWQRS